MNRRDAALHLARRYPGGIDGIAQRMGKCADTLRKELTGTKGYKWGGDDEELMMSLCQAEGVADSLAPLSAAAINHGAVVWILPSAGAAAGAQSFALMAETAREFSEFVQTVAAAEADGEVSANEMKRIEKEAGELMGALQRSVAHMRAQYEAQHQAEGAR
jgi:hypothetical protein